MNRVWKRVVGLLVTVMLISMPLFTNAQTVNVNKDGWLDEVVFFPEKDLAKAIDMMTKGDMDVFFKDIDDPVLFRRIKENPQLAYSMSFGLYNELTFNPVGPEYKDGRLNPFSNARIREAMNLIIDRQYIVDEIMGGLATPKFVPLSKGFPEYERYKSTISTIETTYKYSFARGQKIISDELKKMGAELKGGKWYYKGKPVTVKFIIRTEDRRKAIGDYISGQLEKLGFTVERMYKTSREASPLWMRGDPAEGQWDIYTGGWITTVVARDSADNFQFFYLPDSSMSFSPLWKAYKPTKEFRDLGNKLANRDFTSMKERNLLMTKALHLAMKDSVRIWLVDQNSAWVRRKGVDAVADYAGGYSARVWPYTLKFADKTGGRMRVGSTEVIIDPWNPVAGSNWIYDNMLVEATLGRALIWHPQTGLPILLKIKSAELTVNKDVPTFKNPDTKWLKLTKVDKVTVPADAWYGWDVKKQNVVTAGEAGVKEAKVKVVVNYEDIIGKDKYHDGSVMSPADFIVDWIIGFERASKDSKLYDESFVDTFNSWREQFVAWKIVKTNPLVIEYYINYSQLDAELTATDFAVSAYYPWHLYAIGIRAEEEGKLAFSADKAKEKNVEWMNYIGGPSLSILKDVVERCEKEGYVPFKSFVGKYVDPSVAKERFSSLKKFYEKYGHFWVSNGPYYLDKVDVVAHTALLKNSKFLR